VSSTDSDWREWGRIDPYFAVLSFDRFKHGADRAAFFESGEQAVNFALDRSQAAFGVFKTGRALEFGCGVGRLTIPLARRFHEVVAIDASQHMLAEATANCREAGLHNVRFALSDDQLSAVSGKFDLVFCLNTLQHIRAARGCNIIEHMLTKLADGGLIQIDIPIDHPTPGWLRNASYQRHRLLHRIRGGNPPMQMNVYQLPKLIRRFHEHGMDLTLVTYNSHHGITVAGVGGKKGSTDGGA
jgi:SAM-dependent methyltransferase